jgi:hypothetical protein
VISAKFKYGLIIILAKLFYTVTLGNSFFTELGFIVRTFCLDVTDIFMKPYYTSLGRIVFSK